MYLPYLNLTSTQWVLVKRRAGAVRVVLPCTYVLTATAHACRLFLAGHLDFLDQLRYDLFLVLQGTSMLHP